MPRKYNKKNKNQKRYYNKNKNMNSKLADKKINTLVERRIQEISRKEDKKQYIWYTPSTTIALPTFNWETHGPNLRIPTASMYGMNAGTMWHIRLSDFGNKVKSNLTATAPVPEMNYVRCISLKNRFEIRHQGGVSLKVLIWILAVPSSETLSAQVLIPDIKTAPGGGLNGLYYYRRSILREDLAYKYRILASKVVHLPATREYNSPYTLSNTGSNQGYTFTSSPSLHTEVSKFVELNKFFKGEGKRFQVESSVSRPYKEEVYLCMVGDGVFDFTAVLQQKFRLEGPQQSAMPSLSNPS